MTTRGAYCGRNKRPGPCEICGKTVAVGLGNLIRADGGRGLVLEHAGGCPSQPANTVTASDFEDGDRNSRMTFTGDES